MPELAVVHEGYDSETSREIFRLLEESGLEPVASYGEGADAIFASGPLMRIAVPAEQKERAAHVIQEWAAGTEQRSGILVLQFAAHLLVYSALTLVVMAALRWAWPDWYRGWPMPLTVAEAGVIFLVLNLVVAVFRKALPVGHGSDSNE